MKLHTIQYVQTNQLNKKDNLTRELKIIYVLDSEPICDEAGEKRSHFYDLVHTEFLFFIRTKHLEQELQPAFEHIVFLHSIVDFVEEQWIKIRTLFSIMPRFSLSKKALCRNYFSIF